MIPSQARALKEYVAGAVGSKTPDKEDAPAALRYRPRESSLRPVWYSGKLAVQNSPRQTIPAVCQLSEQASEILPLLALGAA